MLTGAAIVVTDNIRESAEIIVLERIVPRDFSIRASFHMRNQLSVSIDRHSRMIRRIIQKLMVSFQFTRQIPVLVIFAAYQDFSRAEIQILLPQTVYGNPAACQKETLFLPEGPVLIGNPMLGNDDAASVLVKQNRFLRRHAVRTVNNSFNLPTLIVILIGIAITECSVRISRLLLRESPDCRKHRLQFRSRARRIRRLLGNLRDLRRRNLRRLFVILFGKCAD